MRRLLAVAVLLLVAAPHAAGSEEVAHSDNARSVGHLGMRAWVHRAVFQDDLMYASVAGDQAGFDILRLGEDRALTRLSTFACAGNAEAAISRWRNFVFQPVEGRTAGHVPEAPRQPGCSSSDRGGVRVVDVSRPTQPRDVGFISLACGSHNITPFPIGNKVLLYNSNACNTYGEDIVGSTGQGGAGNAALFMEVVEFDKRDPSKSQVVSKVALDRMQGCHDLTIYKPRRLAVCTGMERFALMDVRDPYNPEIITTRDTGDLGAGSAQFTWDGRYVLWNEIPLKSIVYGEQCLGPQREVTGGLHIWNVEDPHEPVHAGRWMYEHQQEMWTPLERDYRCHASTFTVVPTRDKSRYVAVSGWGNGGLSVIDFSDPANIDEIAYWQPRRQNITWLSTWYNGRVYLAENHVPREPDDPTYVKGYTAPRWKGAIRALEIDTLLGRHTYDYREGLVTQWQDPAALRR